MFILALVLLGAMSDPCSILHVRTPVAGKLLVTLSSRSEKMRRFPCLVDGKRVKPVEMPEGGKFESIDWGDGPHRVFMSICGPPEDAAIPCHEDLTTLDGRLLQTFPRDLYAPGLVETDGRITEGGVAGPVRVVAGGEYLAVSAYGRNPALLRRSDGEYVTGFTGGYSSYAWGPNGERLAFVRASHPRGSALIESQLFLYDVRTKRQVQLTHFRSRRYGSWWNPFRRPVTRRPVVAGVSWASMRNLLAFYVVPDRGIFLWSPEGGEVGHIEKVIGACWRLTQLSSDGEQIMYLSASEGRLCLMNGGDHVRVMRSDGSADHVAVETIGDGYVMTDIDWRTETGNGAVRGEHPDR